MEEDKYYVPTEDEFFIGFNYEVKTASYRGVMIGFKEETSTPIKGSEKEVWSKFTWKGTETDSLKGFPFNFITYLENANVRVKYLDHDDIESLGFEKPKYIETRSIPYYKDNEIRLTHIPNEGYEIATRMKGPKGSDRLKAPWHIQIYCIQIKNKSELKKLLTQLGI